jgi:hypothetical protein
MFLRHIDQANAGLSWYIRLIQAGYDSTAGVEDPDPEPEPSGIFTLQDLIGDGQKAWKLKPAARAFGVGPSPGSDEFYPNGNDISSDRPCLFNDCLYSEKGENLNTMQRGIFSVRHIWVSKARAVSLKVIW